MNSLKTLTTLAGTVAIALTAWTYSAPITAAQSAPTVDPALYGGMRWRSLGPARGGRSLTVGGSELRPNEYWFGATGGGVWKTTDGGNNWEAMTDAKIATSSIGSLAVCQSNPDVVYIGGGETQFRGNIIQGDDDDHPRPHAADAGEDRLPSGLPDADDQQGHAQHGHHQTGRGDAGSGRGAGSGHREGIRIAGKTKGPRLTRALNVLEVVGATGFEPATSRSRTERSTKLSHAPMAKRQCSTRVSTGVVESNRAAW